MPVIAGRVFSLSQYFHDVWCNTTPAMPAARMISGFGDFLESEELGEGNQCN
jgi:hypothetical protein